MIDDLDRRLQAWIERERSGTPGDPVEEEDGFNALALELFVHQYEHNAPYRRFCRMRRAEPGRLRDWTEIPPVPLRAFKELTLACEPPEAAAAVFMTSGSTDPHRRGRNHHPHLRLYDASLRAGFARCFLPDRDELRLLVVNPRPETLPESSIAYFLGRLVDRFGAPGSDFFVDEDGLRFDELAAALREAKTTGTAVGLLGTSFAYVHLLDALAARGMSVALPEGSRLLDTGGYKGRSREVSADELTGSFERELGLPAQMCVNYYGMTEISTQYYDDALRNHFLGLASEPRHKLVPPWARIRVVHPETLAPVSAGERGLLVHYDLANRGSCMAVMAEDVGYQVAPTAEGGGGGFVLLGRAEGTEARGCSIALDELLTSGTG